ncbi:hypothetical protein [Methylosinus sp. PW1]|uniref:phage fiber-tail adaptor protein n=1 Tax=Methylosinus sp. PW1 TaxID=107636 RepID=UPI0012EBC06B|nr:hypothetical protein [Methylosinus sp. PW1]
MALAVNRSRMQSFHASDVGVSFAGSFRQRSLEEITYFIDYSRWLSYGSTISSVDFYCNPATSPAISIYASTIVDSGDGALFKIFGGVVGSKYSIDIIAYTSDGQIKIDTILVYIAPSNAQSSSGFVTVSIEEFDVLFCVYASVLPKFPGSPGTAWNNDGSPEISSGNPSTLSDVRLIMSLAQFDALFRAYVSYLPKFPGSPGTAWNNDGSPEISSGNPSTLSDVRLIMSLAQFDALFRAYVSYLPKFPGSPGTAWNNDGSPEISK